MKPRSRGALALAALVALAVLSVSRLHALRDARIMGYDESLYFVQGMIWAEGGVPYRDGWLNKPPLLCAVFAATDALFGPTVTPHRVVQLLTLLGASLCCAWLVLSSVAGRVGPVVATMVVALIASTRGSAGDLWACISEPLFVLPVAAAAVMTLRARALPAGWTQAGFDLLTGASLGLAVQLRQNGLLLVPLAIVSPLLRPGRPRSRLAGVTAIIVGFSVVQALAVALVWPALDHALYWSWTWPRSVQSFDAALLWSTATQVVEREAARMPFVWLAAVGGVVTVGRRALRGRGEARARQLVLLVWGGASLLMTLMGDGGYPHYIVMLAPAAGVFVGIAAAAVAAQLERLRVRSSSCLVGGAALAHACVVALPGLTAPPLDPCERLQEQERSSLLSAVRQLTGPDDKIYVLGSCAPLYYRARRLPAAPDFSGEILLMISHTRRAGVLAPPAPDGRPVPAGEQLAQAVAEHAQLVIDLRTVRPDEERGGRLQGLPVRWDFLNDRVDLSAMEAVLAKGFVAHPVRHDGATLWVRLPARREDR